MRKGFRTQSVLTKDAMEEQCIIYGDSCAKLECPRASIAFLTLLIRSNRETGILYSIDANQRRVDLAKFHEKSESGQKAIVDVVMETDTNDSFQSNPWELTFVAAAPNLPTHEPTQASTFYSIARETYLQTKEENITKYKNASVKFNGIFAKPVSWTQFQDLAYILGVVKVHTRTEIQVRQGIVDWRSIMEHFKRHLLQFISICGKTHPKARMVRIF